MLPGWRENSCLITKEREPSELFLPKKLKKAHRRSADPRPKEPQYRSLWSGLAGALLDLATLGDMARVWLDPAGGSAYLL